MELVARRMIFFHDEAERIPHGSSDFASQSSLRLADKQPRSNEVCVEKSVAAAKGLAALPTVRVKLGEVADEVRDKWSGSTAGVPVVGLEHLEPDEIWLRQWEKDVEENTFTKAFRKGQLLLGRRRVYQKKLSLAPCDGICSGDITVIAAKPKAILPELLPFYLRTDSFFDYAMQGSAGSLSPRVKWAHLADYEFDLPPLDRQRELAKLLWAANDLKEKYKKLITASDEMLKAKFREMFGEMRSAECGMRNVKLGSVCDVLNGFAFQSKKYVDKGTRIIRIANVQKGFIEDKTPAFYSDNDMIGLDRYKLFESDLLMSLTGNVGRVGLVNEELLPAALNQRVACLRISAPELLDKEFLFIQLNQESFESKCIESASGSAQKNMSTEWLKEYELILPPLDLQRQFVEIAAQEEKVKANLKKSIADVDQIIKGLVNG